MQGETAPDRIKRSISSAMFGSTHSSSRRSSQSDMNVKEGGREEQSKGAMTVMDGGKQGSEGNEGTDGGVAGENDSHRGESREKYSERGERGEGVEGEDADDEEDYVHQDPALLNEIDATWYDSNKAERDRYSDDEGGEGEGREGGETSVEGSEDEGLDAAEKVRSNGMKQSKGNKNTETKEWNVQHAEDVNDDSNNDDKGSKGSKGNKAASSVPVTGQDLRGVVMDVVILGAPICSTVSAH